MLYDSMNTSISPHVGISREEALVRRCSISGANFAAFGAGLHRRDQHAVIPHRRPRCAVRLESIWSVRCIVKILFSASAVHVAVEKSLLGRSFSSVPC